MPSAIGGRCVVRGTVWGREGGGGRRGSRYARWVGGMRYNYAWDKATRTWQNGWTACPSTVVDLAEATSECKMADQLELLKLLVNPSTQ